jgi:hypothetical protein
MILLLLFFFTILTLTSAYVVYNKYYISAPSSTNSMTSQPDQQKSQPDQQKSQPDQQQSQSDQQKSQLYDQQKSQLYAQQQSQLYDQQKSQLYAQQQSQLYAQQQSQLYAQQQSQLYAQQQSQLYAQQNAPIAYSSKTIVLSGQWMGDAISDDGKYIILYPFKYSTDSGSTFNNIPGSSDRAQNALQSAISSNGKVQISTKNDNVYGNYYYSTNYGQSWNSGPGIERYFACCVNESGSIIIVTGDQNLHMSTNTGVSWSKYPKSNFTGYGGLHTSWSVSNDGKYHLRTPYAGSAYFYVSNDSMNTWRPFGSLTDSWSYNSSSMSSDGKKQVVNGGSISYMSSDYGITWKSITNYLRLFITIDGTKLFSDNDVSKDFGNTWTNIPNLSFNTPSLNAKSVIDGNNLYKMV